MRLLRPFAPPGHALERAALALEARLRYRGRLIYAGAGTSGRLAVQDGAELMPTFNWPEDRLVLLMAGGPEALLRSVEGAEDEVNLAAASHPPARGRQQGCPDRGRGERNYAIHGDMPAGSQAPRRT